MSHVFADFVRSLTREDKLRDMESVDRTRSAAFVMMLFGATVLLFVCAMVIPAGISPALSILAIPGCVFFIVGVVWGRMAGLLERIIHLEEQLEELRGSPIRRAVSPKSISLPWSRSAPKAVVSEPSTGL